MVLHQGGELRQGVLFGGYCQIQFAIRAQPGAKADDLAARGIGVTTYQPLVHIGIDAGHPLGFLVQSLDHRLPRLVIGVTENQGVMIRHLRMA